MSELTNQEALLNANVAPEQFDWDSFESGLDADARKEKNDLEEIYKGSLNDLSETDGATNCLLTTLAYFEYQR